MPTASACAPDDPLRSLSTSPSQAPARPRWSRLGLIGVTVLAGVLLFWQLTSNRYANGWYGEGVLAASRDWRSLFENAADLSNYVSLDKGPLPDWMMGLSARVLGFGSFSMLLPDVLCGVAAIVVLHDTVRRTFGYRAALIAALMLALSPVSVMMARYNNPESLLTLLMVASAWALVRALESGHLRHVLLCGALVGLAFETKMIVGYLIVPGLAAALLIAGRGRWRRRVAHLSAGAAVMIVVSFAWFAAMMLIPAHDRPYVSDTTDDSWFTLIFGFNGASRLTGGGGVGGLSPGDLVTLLHGAAVGGQIGWLLPLAFAATGAGLWVTRHATRDDRSRAAYLLFGGWMLAGYIIFSFDQGVFHGYYTDVIAPAVAALAAAGVDQAIDRVRGSWRWKATATTVLLMTAGISFLVLDDTPSFLPWLRWSVLGAALIALVLMLNAGRQRRLAPRRRVWISRGASAVVLAVSAVVLLGGPTAYCIATITHGQANGNPTAGPGPSTNNNAANPALVGYLTTHRDSARYIVAANSAILADPIALTTRAPVITIGGYEGTSPAPTVDQLKALVRRDQLHYVMPGDIRDEPTMSRWIKSSCRAITIAGDPPPQVSAHESRIFHRLPDGAQLLRNIRASLRAQNAVYQCSPTRGAANGSQ